MERSSDELASVLGPSPQAACNASPTRQRVTRNHIRVMVNLSVSHVGTRAARKSPLYGRSRIVHAAFVARNGGCLTVKLSVSDPSLGRRTYSGVFDASDPHTFATYLATHRDIKIVRIDTQIRFERRE